MTSHSLLHRRIIHVLARQRRIKQLFPTQSLSKLSAYFFLGTLNLQKLKGHSQNMKQASFHQLNTGVDFWELPCQHGCVFDGTSPNMAKALLFAREELYEWGLAGPKCILVLMPNGE